MFCCYRSTEARKISAQAMILLLSNSRIIGAIPRSQYSESQNIHSQATQTQVEILGTARENESLCFEVLWILKRFFTQPSEVREQLYLGWPFYLSASVISFILHLYELNCSCFRFTRRLSKESGTYKGDLQPSADSGSSVYEY